MKAAAPSILAGLLAVSGIACQKPAPREAPTRGTLALLAPESHLDLVRQEAEEFHRIYPEATVTVSGTSTRDAVVQLLNGRVAAIATDRELNAEEKAVAEAAGLTVTTLVIAKDALGVLVNQENAIPHLAMGTLEGILHRRITRWEEVGGSSPGGAIELALPGRNSGAYELLTRTFFPGGEDPVPAAAMETQAEVREYVATHPRAIGFVSIPMLPDSGASARTVPIEAAGEDSLVAPQTIHQANVYRGFYPLHYPFHLAYVRESSAVAVGFGAFVASAPGQKIILNAGLVPATMPVRLVQVTTD